MKILIGGLDYAGLLDAAHPLTVERKLNAPTLCTFAITMQANGAVPVPKRMQSVRVSGDDGALYFTGYVEATPAPECAGMAMEGPRYRLVVRAISDEVLLDAAAAASGKMMAGMAAGPLFTALAAHTGSTVLSTTGLELSSAIAQFAPEAGAPFSKSAGLVAASARAAYRAVDGALELRAIPVVVHTLDEGNGTLNAMQLAFHGAGKRTPANDVTVCGGHEPAAYVTEYFRGDGATTQFNLAEAPYFLPAAQSVLMADLFDGPAIDTRLWAVTGGSAYFSLNGGGLAMNGGTGEDGQCGVTWMDPVEMGGTLLLEAAGVSLAKNSTGILAAFFSELKTVSGCVAGFQATAQQGTGAVSLQPVIAGALSGAAYATSPDHLYTLRIRMHCLEVQRQLATYLAHDDTGVVANGDAGVVAGAKLHFEVQEFVDGVAGMPVTLYDGEVASIPGACWVAAASSVNLHGNVRALRLESLGTCWVKSKPAEGSVFTPRLGSVVQGGECFVDRAGRVVFNAGFAPGPEEQVAVSYRTIARAVGRAVNAGDQQESGTSAWVGSVTSPAARSSADCRNAAATLAATASSANASWSGTYRATNFELDGDVWPGDALAMIAPSCGLDAQMVVRSVALEYRASVPDLVVFTVAFANDWAEDLAIKTSASVPADAWLPAAVSPNFVANLNALSVTGVDGETVTLTTGVTAPLGGGFEVRRRDHVFLPGEDSDLILRGSESTMTLPRFGYSDRYYIRMFDGATPPHYSEFSAAVFLNLPRES